MRKLKRTLKIFLKGLLSILILLVLLLILSIPYGRTSEKKMIELGVNYQKIVIKGVHILPMETNQVLYNQNIYIDNGSIWNITPDTVPLFADFEVIEAKGKFILPGLIDMHAHVFDRTDLPQYLSYGVTTVRNMMGFPMHLRWKEQLKQNKLIGGNLITSTPTINSGDNSGPFHIAIEGADEAKVVVNEYIDLGYDFIKVYDDLDSLQLNAIEKTAKLKNVKIAGHPPKITLKGLLNSSLVSIEHSEELLKFLDKKYSEKSMRALAKKIKASNKAVTINLLAFNRINRIVQEGLTYYESLQSTNLNPVTRFIGRKQLEVYTKAGPKYKAFAVNKYRAMEKLSKILNEEGVTILFGTDSGPNFIAAGPAIIEELQLLKNAGLPEYDILKSATCNAAKILGRNDLGSISIGSKADLILIDKNPLNNLQSLSKIEYVFSNKKYYTNTQLDKVRSIGEDKQNTYATIGLFLEHLINK